MIDVGRSDHARLEREYGVSHGPIGTVARKTWKIAARLVGATLIRAAIDEPAVFHAIRDGRIRLLVRQVATLRASMATGDAPPANEDT